MGEEKKLELSIPGFHLIFFPSIPGVYLGMVGLWIKGVYLILPPYRGFIFDKIRFIFDEIEFIFFKEGLSLINPRNVKVKSDKPPVLGKNQINPRHGEFIQKKSDNPLHHKNIQLNLESHHA